MIHTWYFKSITSSLAKLMEGDGDDEDNDVDQQEPLPRLTTYKEAGYNCFGRCVLLIFKFLVIKGMDMKPCPSVQLQIHVLTRLLT